MIELNKEEKFDVLSFQFEMLGVDEAARDVASKVNKSVKEVYSAGSKLSNADLALIDTALEQMRNYPINVVDNIGTVDQIKDTILYYVSENDLIGKNRGLIITLDHSLLVRGGDGEDEKQTLDRLMHTLVLLKKYFNSIGLKIMFFVLSQLNRAIESPDRVTNSKLHYPTKNDLFGASSVYYSSDYVMILHQPALVDGIGLWYGPGGQETKKIGYEMGLPVFNPSNKNQPMIYLHVIKERFGNRTIIPMLNELSAARLTEYTFKH